MGQYRALWGLILACYLPFPVSVSPANRAGRYFSSLYSMLWRCVVRVSLMSGRLGFQDYSVILGLGYVFLGDYRYIRIVAFAGATVRGRGMGLGLWTWRGRRA